MRKMAVYLGLVEDDHRYQDKYDSYGEYEDYDDQADRPDQVEETEARVVGRDGDTGGGYAGYRARGPADDRSRPHHDAASSHLQ
jgi:cell division inhibitor SepF